jgi:iron(III) transport system substrate-binding protein
MRLNIVSLVLAAAAVCVAPLAHSFEIEHRQNFASKAAQPVTLRILSTADIDLFAPLILSFQAENPKVAVTYHAVSSTELMRALQDEQAPYDIAVSSAMDLQTKLANDGFALAHRSNETNLLPEWGKWRDHVFAFTQEPAAIVLSAKAFANLPVPQTRQDLISVLRDHPDLFRGRVGTYDVRSSGLGYLFATQDARTSETFWRLAEVMGHLDIQLYCCSGAMIDDVSSGKIAVAYNVLGSYAMARRDAKANIHIITPQDFTTVMLRTALIPTTAQRPALAGQFIDHLIRAAWLDETTDSYPFPDINRDPLASNTSLRPIRMGPGLLVYLDKLKKRQFLNEWENAILQP